MCSRCRSNVTLERSERRGAARAVARSPRPRRRKPDEEKNRDRSRRGVRAAQRRLRPHARRVRAGRSPAACRRSPAVSSVTQPGPNRPLAKTSNPYGMDANVLNEGRRLFIWFNCYGCHGGRAGGGMGPSLRDPDWLYGNTDQAIFNSIAEGRQHGMPAWGTKLPDEEMWKITAYIKSMGTEAEPDAPPANPVFPKSPTEPRTAHHSSTARETGDAPARPSFRSRCCRFRSAPARVRRST